MNNNFNNMDDIFNQLMGNMGGFNTERRRYSIMNFANPFLNFNSWIFCICFPKR